MLTYWSPKRHYVAVVSLNGYLNELYMFNYICIEEHSLILQIYDSFDT